MLAVNKRLRRAAVVGALTGLVTAAGLTGASPAQSHDSNYCGHGSSGIIDVTIYQHYHGNPHGQSGHLHHYHHYMFDGSTHAVHRYC